MIRYRPFLNSDPPAIVDIWRSRPPLRGRVQSITPAVLERSVFSKLYFDPAGLLLALDDDQPIGFAHAGFGPARDRSALSTDRGITCLLMVVPRDDGPTVAAELLARSEQYLTSRGARQLCASGAFPLDPFYLGLYGGSQLSGVLASDRASLEIFRAAGYVQVRRHAILQRQLAGFRPRVDRRQLGVRRRFHIEATVDPPAGNWWEACTVAQAHRTQFSLIRRDSARPCGRATFWDIEPLASDWHMPAMGLIDLQVPDELRRQGLATYLLGEALGQLRSDGVMLAEAHVPRDNFAAMALFNTLGFREIEEAFVLSKPV